MPSGTSAALLVCQPAQSSIKSTRLSLTAPISSAKCLNARENASVVSVG